MASASSLAAGCGGHAAAPPPQLGSGPAGQIVTLAQRVATDTNGCAARNDIAALNAKVQELVGSGQIPVRLRAQLLGGVAALTADAPACTPTPSGPPGKPKGKPDHGHGHGHGNGQGEND